MNQQSKRTLKIGISDKATNGNALVRCRTVTLRERVLRWLFGDLRRVTVIVPSDSIHDITIQEIPERGQ